MPFIKPTIPGHLGQLSAKSPQEEDISATSGKMTPNGPSISTCNCARFRPPAATFHERKPPRPAATCPSLQQPPPAATRHQLWQEDLRVQIRSQPAVANRRFQNRTRPYRLEPFHDVDHFLSLDHHPNRAPVFVLERIHRR